MNEFKSYHPLVNFVYFAFVIGFGMFFMHPVCLAVSFACGFVYSAMMGKFKAVKVNLLYMLPMVIISAAINAAFNHEGMTVLRYLPDGNPLTLESIVYGFAAAFMIVSVICWFSCFNYVMTDDKFTYLFGRIIPSLSLVFSMTLRFIPRFTAQIKKVSAAQRCIGRDVSAGNLIQRAKNGISILSVAMTWALENSVDTADSMRSRGYGLPGRSAFSVFRFDRRDAWALGCMAVLGVYVLIGSLLGALDFKYFPYIKGAHFSIYGCSVMLAYFALCAVPILIELFGFFRWKALQNKDGKSAVV